jgi:hypothetical protein
MFEKKQIVLTQLQLQSNLLKHHLKQEVPIHWNSTYYMLEQLLEQEKAVQDFAGQGVRRTREGFFFNLCSAEADKLCWLSPFSLGSHC